MKSHSERISPLTWGVRNLRLCILVIPLALVGCGGAADFAPLPVEEVPQDEPIPNVVADPVRGALLFATTPKAGVLICADCHSDNPVANNFGNIWSGRHAASLIQRAVSSNTGGMGYLGNLYSAADFSDIAAYLGTSPVELKFPATVVGSTSASLQVNVLTSTKVGMDNVAIRVIGDFRIVTHSCNTQVPRFSTCSIEVTFAPKKIGGASGAVLIQHDGSAAPVRVTLVGEGS